MSCEDDGELRRGPWTLQEDNLLIHYIASCGEGNWNLLAKRSGLKRTGKSCRLRWLNYLKPDVKRGNLSSQEQLLILQLHLRWGNRWSKIAQQLPGRTDNEIKNYWRTKIHKQGRHMKMDTNSRAFQDMVRCFWIPRLLQKIQHSQNSIDQPPQAQAQAQAPDMGQTTIQEVNQHEYQVYSDQSTSSGITCSDSINTFQLSDISNNNLFNSSESCLGAACSIENFPIENCQMVKSNWVDSCFPDDGYWDCGMDELWQFSNIM